MTFREKILRQLAFLSLLISVVMTAMVFNQSDDGTDESESAG